MRAILSINCEYYVFMLSISICSETRFLKRSIKYANDPLYFPFGIADTLFDFLYFESIRIIAFSLPTLSAINKTISFEAPIFIHFELNVPYSRCYCITKGSTDLARELTIFCLVKLGAHIIFIHPTNAGRHNRHGGFLIISAIFDIKLIGCWF